MSRKPTVKRRVIAVPIPLHTRLKMLATSRNETIETLVREILWRYAKKSTLVIPRANDEE